MQKLVEQLLEQINQIVIGKPTETQLALACLLAKGHLLIEDLPGMGKTTLAHTLANVLQLSFQRLQFTSDLLPADIVGFSMFDQQAQQFTLHKGAIFSQLLLADEINRASPKSQSALLEAMEEGQVSIDGTSYPLPEPFFVIATQNPLHHAGTYPLPESQLDRFTMRLSLGFPSNETEKKLLLSVESKPYSVELPKLITPEQLFQLQEKVLDCYCSDSILNYVIALCQVTRQAEFSGHPLSPRASKSLLNCAKAWAFIQQRDYVTADDIKAVFNVVCQHRISGGQHDYFEQDNNLAQQVLKQVDPTQC